MGFLQGKKAGFFSFVLASVLLLSFLAAAARFSSIKPDSSYQKFTAAHVEEVAIKKALYSSISETASNAVLIAKTSGISERQAARLAAHDAIVELQNELRASGYDISFWCGKASEQEISDAQALMDVREQAAVPQGAQEFSASSCIDSVDADSLSGKLHFFSMGFSVYSRELGAGYAAVLPSSYEVDFQ